MSYPIADYFTVFPSASDSTGVAGESVFNVPASTYMSNAKGQYCLVSLVDGSTTRDGETDQASATPDEEAFSRMIILDGVLNNGGNDAVIGTFDVTTIHGDSKQKYSYTPNNIKYLISARPSQLRIKVIRADGTTFNFQSGHLTFKFEYLSKSEVEEMNDQSDYTTF